MKSHHYQIEVRHTADKDGQAIEGHSLSFSANNHDEVLDIIARVQQAGLFPADEAAAFALGLKLFSETMLKHRQNPLFADIQPAMREFIGQLKAHLAQASAQT